MPKLRPVLFALLLAACPVLARADTLDFTVTITEQNGIYTVPVGTVYTGTAHYAGVWDLYNTGYPPVIDAFTFTYPSAPTSVSDYYQMATQRHVTGGPLFLLTAYLNPAIPNGSFDIIGSGFALFNPDCVMTNGWCYSQHETGAVTYTLVPDPIAITPEPASFALLGTGALGACDFLLRRLRAGEESALPVAE